MVLDRDPQEASTAPSAPTKEFVCVAFETAKIGVRALGESCGQFQFVQVDEKHAILVSGFPDAETEERISSEIDGLWMEHIVLLLDGLSERSSGEPVAG